MVGAPDLLHPCVILMAGIGGNVNNKFSGTTLKVVFCIFSLLKEA